MTNLTIANNLPLPIEFIERRIYLIRGQKVMFDYDLAILYQVTTGNLNLAVKRNLKRFPSDFMFKLSRQENDSLLLQIAIAKTGRGGRQTPPFVFTEHGVAMLSSVLKSERAVQMNIFIIRAFIKLRELLASHKDLAKKMEHLERQQIRQGAKIEAIDKVIKELINLPEKPKKQIGFRAQ